MEFRTIYQTDYKKKPFKPSHLVVEKYLEYQNLDEGAVWLDSNINVKGLGYEGTKKKIHEMYVNRFKSVYTIDYQRRPSPATDTNIEEVKPLLDVQEADQMLETCKRLKLSKAKQPVLPPLLGARKLLGYMNPKYFHISLTEYQDQFGIFACNAMFGNDLKGSRGFLEQDSKKNHLEQISANSIDGEGMDYFGKQCKFRCPIGKRRCINCR